VDWGAIIMSRADDDAVGVPPAWGDEAMKEERREND
jgi:hypothetical protein